MFVYTSKIKACLVLFANIMIEEQKSQFPTARVEEKKGKRDENSFIEF
jgi:hypothetical protein